MIHRVALHVPPVGFQSEVADAFEAFRSESFVTEQHPAILKQFNLLLYSSCVPLVASGEADYLTLC